VQSGVAETRAAQRKPDARNAAQPDEGVAHDYAGLGMSFW
jgi:hypothetical protein